MSVLRVENLSKQFGSQEVIKNVSFTIESHSQTALIGPNGAGKTTILSMLTGLLQPTSGVITMPNVADIRKEIGFLPQYPKFFSWMSALEFVEMAAQLSFVNKRDSRKKAMEMLAFVGLEEAMHKKIGTFSGGMKQRLGIAQAIIHEPKLLLLDEPVSALDPTGRRDVMSLLKQLQERTSILYSTHILNDAEQMADHVLFLRDGQFIEQGSLAYVKAKYNEPKIQIEFASEFEAAMFNLNGVKLVKDAKTITLSSEGNEQQLMLHVLAHLSEQQLNIEKIEHVTTSLEDLFMKVANT